MIAKDNTYMDSLADFDNFDISSYISKIVPLFNLKFFPDKYIIINYYFDHNDSIRDIHQTGDTCDYFLYSPYIHNLLFLCFPPMIFSDIVVFLIGKYKFSSKIKNIHQKYMRRSR